MANAQALEAAKAFIAKLSADDQKGFEGMTEAGLEQIGAGVLMQADYTVKTTEAAELLKKNQTTEEELKKWRETANATVNTTLKENEALKTQQAAYEARLQTLATQYGVPAEEIAMQQQTAGGSEAQAAAQVAQQGGEAATAGQEGAQGNVDYQRYVDSQVETSLTIGAQLTDILDEHRELFDERIRAEDLIREASAAGKNLREYWEGQHNVVDKRATIETARQEAHDQKIRDEARDEARKEMVDEGYEPSSATVSFGSPLLDQAREGNFNTKDDDGNPMFKGERDKINSVDAAVKRFKTEGLANIAKQGAFALDEQ